MHDWVVVPFVAGAAMLMAGVGLALLGVVSAIIEQQRYDKLTGRFGWWERLLCRVSWHDLEQAGSEDKGMGFMSQCWRCKRCGKKRWS